MRPIANTINIALFLASLAVLGAGCAQAPKSAAPSVERPAQPGSSTNESVSGMAADGNTLPGDIVYTLDEVAAHNAPNDCWLVIHSKVYDVTRFIPVHPGGSEIFKGCGKDATDLFEARPPGGAPHSSRAREALNGFEIGALAQ
jgi:cytochrome b involved in lipid metabolism